MPLASSLYWAARAAVQRVATAGFTTLADPMFDEAAFFAVHELLAVDDTEGLRPLASPAVAEAFKGVLSHYTEQGMRLRSLRVDELRDVQIVRSTVVEGTGLGLPDLPEEASLLGSGQHTMLGGSVRLPETVGTLYLVIWVRYDSTEVCELENTADGSLSRVTNSRGHVWSFARALPRRLPAAQGLETAWRLTGLH